MTICEWDTMMRGLYKTQAKRRSQMFFDQQERLRIGAGHDSRRWTRDNGMLKRCQVWAQRSPRDRRSREANLGRSKDSTIR
jgi:hypothetical protein